MQPAGLRIALLPYTKIHPPVAKKSPQQWDFSRRPPSKHHSNPRGCSWSKLALQTPWNGRLVKGAIRNPVEASRLRTLRDRLCRFRTVCCSAGRTI